MHQNQPDNRANFLKYTTPPLDNPFHPTKKDVKKTHYLHQIAAEALVCNINDFVNFKFIWPAWFIVYPIIVPRNLLLRSVSHRHTDFLIGHIIRRRVQCYTGMHTRTRSAIAGQKVITLSTYFQWTIRGRRRRRRRKARAPAL